MIFPLIVAPVITFLLIILDETSSDQNMESDNKTAIELTKGEIEEAKISDADSISVLDYIKENNLENLLNTESNPSARIQADPTPCLVNDAEVSKSRLRLGVPDQKYRWKTEINFRIDTKFNIQENQTIVIGLGKLQYVLDGCLKFKLPKMPIKIKDYVFIQKKPYKKGCGADVGKITKQPQNIYLAPDFIQVHVVIHQVMHALGFFHEHNRPDRDNNIIIFEDNISPENIGQFIKLNNSFLTFGTAYNTSSIMHYDCRSFRKNKQPTMILKKNADAIYTKTEMADSDKVRLKAMYCKGQ